jgi:hypothetical protein
MAAAVAPRHSKLTPPFIRWQIASGLSTNFRFGTPETTTVIPSGIAPIGWITMILIPETQIPATNAMNAAIAMIVIRMFPPAEPNSE